MDIVFDDIKIDNANSFNKKAIAPEAGTPNTISKPCQRLDKNQEDIIDETLLKKMEEKGIVRLGDTRFLNNDFILKTNNPQNQTKIENDRIIHNELPDQQNQNQIPPEETILKPKKDTTPLSKLFMIGGGLFIITAATFLVLWKTGKLFPT